MKNYEKPEIKIIKIEIEDVVAVSVAVPEIDGGNIKFIEEWLK